MSIFRDVGQINLEANEIKAALSTPGRTDLDNVLRTMVTYQAHCTTTILEAIGRLEDEIAEIRNDRSEQNH